MTALKSPYWIWARVNRIKLLISLVLIVLAACSSPALTAGEIAAAMPTVAAARTQTAASLPPASATPGPTSTPSLTPLPPFALTATANFVLTGPHGDGVFRVGLEISSGLWRSIPQRDGYCYWARRKYDGILLAEYYGPPGEEILIREGDYEVEFDGCGMFVFMGN